MMEMMVLIMHVVFGWRHVLRHNHALLMGETIEVGSHG